MLVNDDFMILSPHLRSISPKKAGPDHLWRWLPAWAVLWFWGYWETEEGHFYVTTSMQAITCKHLLIIPSKITWNQPLPERQDPIPWMGIWRPGSKGGMPDPLRVQKPRGSHKDLEILWSQRGLHWLINSECNSYQTGNYVLKWCRLIQCSTNATVSSISIEQMDSAKAKNLFLPN